MTEEVFQSIESKEITLSDSTSAGFVKNASDGTLSGGNTIGTQENPLTAIWVTLAIITSIALGAAIGLSNVQGTLFINASTFINGSLNVTSNVTAEAFIGDGSALTGVLADFQNGSVINISDGFIDVSPIATLDDLTGGNVTVSSIIRVQNKVGTSIGPLTLLFFSGYNVGQNAPEAQYAINTDKEKHAECVTSETIANNGFGSCVVIGLINNVDTSQFTALEELHLNTTEGTMTLEEPLKVECLQEVGLVLRSHPSLGVLFTHITSGCVETSNFVNVTGNWTAGDNITSRFGDDSDAEIFFNGTMLRIKVN